MIQDHANVSPACKRLQVLVPACIDDRCAFHVSVNVTGVPIECQHQHAHMGQTLSTTNAVAVGPRDARFVCQRRRFH